MRHELDSEVGAQGVREQRGVCVSDSVTKTRSREMDNGEVSFFEAIEWECEELRGEVSRWRTLALSAVMACLWMAIAMAARGCG